MRRWVVALGFTVLVAPVRATEAQSVQEVLLRAKPAVALVISEVAAQVTLNCGGARTTVEPAPFRETGTGWFVSASGWLITNAHVVSPAHRPPEWLNAEMAKNATRAGCRATNVKLEPSISVVLSNGTRSPATVAKYSPPVAGEDMSGRDPALLRLEAADLPALTLGASTAPNLGVHGHLIAFPGGVLTAGLPAFSAAARPRAARTLAEANRLMPGLPDVARSTRENDEKIKKPPPQPSPWAIVAAGVTLVSVGAYGTMFVLRWRRNRFRIK